MTRNTHNTLGYIVRPRALNFGRWGGESVSFFLADGTKNHFISFCKKLQKTGSEIRKIRVFKHNDCTFGARVLKKKKKKKAPGAAGTERVN